jgi:hypothetical protein
MIMFGNFANYGFVRDIVPNQLLENLKQEITQLDKNIPDNITHNLAGNIEIERQLSVCQNDLESYVLELCRRYENNWGVANTCKNLSSNNLEMNVYWVNFQKKHEFNPMHTHEGTYSFVIWLKVPFKIQDELSTVSTNKTNMPRAGMFSFMYTNIFGEIREAEFPIDESYEGTIFLFPSALTHQVYPFSTSDEYRISISGNVRKKQ